MWSDTSAAQTDPGGWTNWGGDKTWLAPQSEWTEWSGRRWPPDVHWGDPQEGPHTATWRPDGSLHVVGPVSPRTGLRLSRVYRLEGREWITEQSVENVSGAPIRVALWSVTNIARPEAVYMVPSPSSVHPKGYFESRTPAPEMPTRSWDGLLEVLTTNTHTQKLGLDTPWVAIAATRSGETLIQQAPHFPGQYPHGGNGAGSSVEYYDTGSDAPVPYVELELLAPLTELTAGQSATLTMRWRIEQHAESWTMSQAGRSTLLRWLKGD